MISQSMRDMAARLRADPFVQAVQARLNFKVAAAVEIVLDLNDMNKDYRRVLAERWCMTHATGRWLRRVVERRGHAVLDRVVFEFEADATALGGWLKSKGW